MEEAFLCSGWQARSAHLDDVDKAILELERKMKEPKRINPFDSYELDALKSEHEIRVKTGTTGATITPQVAGRAASWSRGRQ